MHPEEELFNPRFSTQPENCTDMDALRAAWRSLSTAESTSTPGRRLGIARRRTELLSVNPWVYKRLTSKVGQANVFNPDYAVGDGMGGTK